MTSESLEELSSANDPLRNTTGLGTFPVAVPFTNDLNRMKVRHEVHGISQMLHDIRIFPFECHVDDSKLVVISQSKHGWTLGRIAPHIRSV